MDAGLQLPPEVGVVIAREWGVDCGDGGVRLTGGEDSAAYRVGEVVVRVGPLQRGSAVMEWCHGVAEAAACLGEVVVPLRTDSGASVVRVAGRPVSVWPLVAGRWLELGNPAEVEQAARLLARVHRELRGVQLPPRPEVSYLEPAAEVHDPAGLAGSAEFDRWRDVLRDEQLDRWLGEFWRRAAKQPLHGDYYRGNVLVHDGRIAGLIDWDESWVGAPEMELAGAAREFGEHWSTDLRRAQQFVAWYHDEGGTAAMDDETMVQLIRHRLRAEVVQFADAADPDDDYHARQVQLFSELRP
ncbi:aminoglycoside phosphotransferase [Kribbella flavida DSM 17836]|uniref:Aminoglycoside phosphotransferase n=1 Tax=Kribbella flavida (strain DSM 17836 / JCM 10339 / NBRC 14399) TaxID=479435 RepID=D2PSY4_KRIFD|nr:phosphotransferase [Kribbella flavida]ADB35036.1 aminoglycoside phosphotransferase [Kribbella flavida DSM 17836]